MTIKVLDVHYADGYTLAASYSGGQLTALGSVDSQPGGDVTVGNDQ